MDGGEDQKGQKLKKEDAIAPGKPGPSIIRLATTCVVPRMKMAGNICMKLSYKLSEF